MGAVDKVFYDLDLKALPLSKRMYRDDCSALIFLHYYTQINPKAQRNLSLALKSQLEENSHSYPVEKNFVKALLSKNIKIKSTFKIEKSASLSHGLCAAIMRIVHHGKLTEKNIKKIGEHIKAVEELGIRKGESIFWPSYFYQSDGSYALAIALNLHRGMGGIITTLSLCHHLGIERKKTFELLSGAINQVLKIDDETGNKELPIIWGNSQLKSVPRHTCFYGDPGMGYAITLAGYRCNNKVWISRGKSIFKRGIVRSPEKSYVNGITFGSGAIGLTHIIQRFYELTGDEDVLIQRQRWTQIADRMFKEGEHIKDAFAEILSKKVRIPNALHNSILGYYLVKWNQASMIDSHWDSIYGLSNPISKKII